MTVGGRGYPAADAVGGALSALRADGGSSGSPFGDSRWTGFEFFMIG